MTFTRTFYLHYCVPSSILLSSLKRKTETFRNKPMPTQALSARYLWVHVWHGEIVEYEEHFVLQVFRRNFHTLNTFFVCQQCVNVSSIRYRRLRSNTQNTGFNIKHGKEIHSKKSTRTLQKMRSEYHQHFHDRLKTHLLRHCITSTHSFVVSENGLYSFKE